MSNPNLSNLVPTAKGTERDCWRTYQKLIDSRRTSPPAEVEEEEARPGSRKIPSRSSPTVGGSPSYFLSLPRRKMIFHHVLPLLSSRLSASRFFATPPGAMGEVSWGGIHRATETSTWRLRNESFIRASQSSSMVFRETVWYLCLALDLFLLARREVSSVVGKQNLGGPRHGRSHGLPYADLLFRRLRRRRPLAGRIWKHTGSLLGIRGRMRMDIPPRYTGTLFTCVQTQIRVHSSAIRRRKEGRKLNKDRREGRSFAIKGKNPPSL